MKNFTKLLYRTVVLLPLSTTPSFAQEMIDQTLTAPIMAYEAAMNASDLKAVMALYTVDAVFMPQNSPPATGKLAVTTAYKGLFSALDLDIKFAFDETQRLSENWAFVRTRSSGTIKLIQQNNAVIPNDNQEMFMLNRVDGEWRIARYIFNTTTPAR